MQALTQYSQVIDNLAVALYIYGNDKAKKAPVTYKNIVKTSFKNICIVSTIKYAHFLLALLESL